MFKRALLFLLLMAVAGSAHAGIRIEPDFEGTLLILFPNGEVALVEPNETIPDIPSGSALEVFDGAFTVTADEGDTVTVSCLGAESEVQGASVNIVCQPESGKFKVLKGLLAIVDAAGNPFSLPAGGSHLIGTALAVPLGPTGAGEQLGFPQGDSTPPSDTDSRNIQSSP